MNLVTGATGILGIQVMAELIQRGEKVRGLKRRSADLSTAGKLLALRTGRENAVDEIEWFEGNVLDVTSLLEAMEGIEHVYHCAAVVSYHADDRDAMYEINVEGTANVVNAALELKKPKICFVSSIAALGKLQNNSWLDEKTEWADSDYNTHYGITKNLSEMEVWRGIQEGLEAIIVNPGFIIGPGDFARSSASVFRKIDEGMSYYPPGGTGFVGVKDCASMMVSLMKKNISGERYILVAENWSMQELFVAIAQSIGKKIPTKEATPAILQLARIAEWFKQFITFKKALITKETVKNASVRFYYKNDKVKSVLGQEFHPIQDAIAETAQIYRQFNQGLEV
ncbi:MAG: NAD-dependent epimerase/dehydratase family protein [Flavobacteriales bacterium]|nr:NAD-dependent epimerase/dehydratase family protein [Flavobacteriales bacterium]